MVRRVRHRIGRSLRLRFALSMAVLVAVVGGAVALVGAHLLEDALIEAHAEASERIARQIADDESAATTDELETVLREAIRHADGVFGAAVYRATTASPIWTRVAVVGDIGVPVVLTRPPSQESRRVARTSDGHEFLTVTVPSEDGRYAIRLARSLDGCDAVEDRAQLVLLGLAAAFVAIGALVGDRLGRRWLFPLRALLDAMRDVTNGRFGRRLDTTDQDELGALARRFNMMARTLERHREEAEGHASGLERRVLERTAELERANAALCTLDRAKDAFLSNVSHEMRTPLTSILASVEILRQFGQEDAAAREEFLQIVDKESKRLLELIDGVLEIVALEAAPLTLEQDHHDLHRIAEIAIAGATARAAERDVTVLLHVCSPDTTTICDGPRVVQVLDGLLDNAVKFSPRGATVDVTVEATEELVEIRVRDEGEGLDPEQADQVFAKFTQVGRSLTDKPSGFGLGLPFARRIAEAHDGSVRFEQESGFGATFVISLPRRTATSPQRSVDAAPRAETSPALTPS